MDILSVVSFLNGHISFTLLAANPQGSTLLFFGLIILLVITFIISGAEVALFSLSNKDVNMLKTKQHAAAKRITTLLEHPKEVYAALLIAGTFINICIIILSNFLISQYFPYGSLHLFNKPWMGFVIELLIRVLVIGFVLVFFGRLLPKVWATQNNLRFAYDSSFVIEAIYLLLRRLSHWIVTLANVIGRRVGADKSEAMNIQELDEAIDFKTDDEASPAEKSIMKGIVKFGNISVRQIMRSRLDVSGVEFNTSFGDLTRKVEELHYSRLPVFKNSLDEMVGMINTKDLLAYLNEPENFDWHSLMRQPYFVPESKLIEDLLKDFQQKRIHFAVVVDEFGGTSGIVTMEDVLEEVIGDIKDEFDEEESGNKKLDDNNYIFEGKTMIHDICKTMRLSMNTFDKVRGESESLAGLILEVAGQFPDVNSVISVGDFDFTILQTDSNRIQQVKVTIKAKANS